MCIRDRNRPVSEYKREFEDKRPQVIDIQPFENGTNDVNSSIKTITITFSDPMNTRTSGFDFGPLGEKAVLRVQKVIGYSDDGKSFTFEVEMKPNQKYQMEVSRRFTSENGMPLKPYLVDIKTRE